jgi:hypothetical protein
MGALRVPLIVAVGAFAVKVAAVLVYRRFRIPELGVALTAWDPLSVRFAEAALPLFYNLRGVAPPAGASELYDFLLVAGFAAQCFAVAWALTSAARLFGRRGR